MTKPSLTVAYAKGLCTVLSFLENGKLMTALMTALMTELSLMPGLSLIPSLMPVLSLISVSNAGVAPLYR